ncbi:glycosyltransferase family 2 protein [Nigerium massiliense]|uniref:glycosyltransferase family 2 protein n=1 Tax=Nigerium massiliense TaxID=1522317 RepID=UPI00058EB719|nr:glycosyltransferase [Nigerium massiliense]
MATLPTVSALVLSMGNRPTELARALETLHAQTGVELQTVLIGNGWEPEGVPDWVETRHEPENLGCVGGRNAAATLATGEYLFFYDDDAFLPSTDVLERMVAALQEPGVGVVQPRGVDPDGRPSPRRWVPRLFTKNAQGGDAAVFWEALCMMRRSAFESVGGWPPDFFFGHEGADIAMRLLDRGWRIVYHPEIEVCHPATTAARHDHFYRLTARNRAWVARRNLPLPLAVGYLAVWSAATVVRVRRPHALRVWFGGLAEGLRGPVPGGRKPIRWSTAWRMTRLGRPPLW